MSSSVSCQYRQYSSPSVLAQSAIHHAVFHILLHLSLPSQMAPYGIPSAPLQPPAAISMNNRPLASAHPLSPPARTEPVSPFCPSDLNLAPRPDPTNASKLLYYSAHIHTCSLQPVSSKPPLVPAHSNSGVAPPKLRSVRRCSGVRVLSVVVTFISGHSFPASSVL